jgi:putative SOS response-associated peptidase YedK
MCGRYELHTNPVALALALGLKYPPEIRPRYNVAPTQQVPIARLSNAGERELSQVRWGLVPFWAKDPTIGNKMINARADTIATKPGFREAFKKARCLVPASGFYEWAKMTDGTKQPVHFGMKDDGPFAFAGLWSRWGPKDGEQLETCTIITTGANELCRRVHDRMPVILAAENYTRWLDIEQSDPADLLRPFASDAMRAYPVSTRVNSPKNDDPEIIAPLDIHLTAIEPLSAQEAK